MPSHAAAAIAALVALAGSTASGAGPDNNVEWDGLSHVQTQDLRPLVPLRGDAVTVRFQSFREDLTAAVVRWSDGVASGTTAASVASTRGPYDVWEATLPATTRDALTYTVEAIDGTARAHLGPGGDAGAVGAAVPGAPFRLDFVTLSHARRGATPTPGGVVFKVWAPGAASAWVRGTFNAWGLGNPMTRVGEEFIAVVPGAGVGDRYKFFFPGNVWKPDPYATSLLPSDNDNSVVTDPRGFVGVASSFAPRPLEELVVYQLHVQSFSGRNDPLGFAPSPSRYADVAARAGHLAALGVNAVMVNPINEYPGSFSGGYNPISMFAVESALGTPDDLKAMIDALHAEGVAVLLDVVWNHVDGNGNFLWNFDGTQVYFDTPAVNTPWGSQLDLDREAVRRYLLDSAETLMGEFGFDGFRHDAVYEVVSANQAASGQALVRRLTTLMDRRHADKHVIAEIYSNDPWVTRPVAQGGLGFDAQYHERFKNAIHDETFAAGLGDPSMARLADGIDGSGPWVEGDRVLNYFELHDDAWPLNGRQRAVRTIDTTAPHDDRYARGRTKLANGLTILAKGVPAILQGTEWLEDDGWETKIDWSHKDRYAETFDYYRDLITLRTTTRALFANSGVWVHHINDGANVLAFERWGDDGRSFVVVANFSNTDWGAYAVGLPRPGRWGVIVNSEDSAYGGRGAGDHGPFTAGDFTASNAPRDGMPHSAVLSIPAHGLMLLQHEPEFLDPCSSADVAQAFGTLNVNDIVDFVNAFNAGVPLADVSPAPSGDGVFNVNDIVDFVNAFNAGCP